MALLAEHWTDNGPALLLGLKPIQYLALLLGLALIGFLIATRGKNL